MTDARLDDSLQLSAKSLLNNPLIDLSQGIKFSEIQPSHYVSAVEFHILVAEARFREIAKQEDPRNFENTMMEFDRASKDVLALERILKEIGELKATPEHEDEFVKVDALITRFKTEMYLNEGLGNAIKEYSQSEDAQELRGEKKRFLELTLFEFNKRGANLSPVKKEELKAINERLAEVTTKFRANVKASMDEKAILVIDENKLQGLPESVKDIFAENAAKKGKDGWLITLDATSYINAMRYLDNQSLREAVYKAKGTVASEGDYSNASLIPEILDLRKRQAVLLGYDNFADLVTATRLAKSGETARSLLHTLKEECLPAFQKECDELEAFYRKTVGSDAPPLNVWDIDYYVEKLKQEKYAFNTEDLRPYFQAEMVFDSFFDLANKLYGVTVLKDDSLSVWDKSVETYSVYDKDGVLLLQFYADLFPRSGEKGDGAHMEQFIIGAPYAGSHHIGIVSGNFTPPTKDIPALLSLDDARTYFHELGHLMQLCLSTTEISQIAAGNVPWDSVEFPSQIMENFFNHPEILSKMGRHYLTGEPIPNELLEKAVEALKYRMGTFYMRQLALGITDLNLHIDYDPKVDGDAVEFARKIMQEANMARLPDEYRMLCAISHFFGDPEGYGAGYYSYIYANIFEADAFTRFTKEGIYNPETGADLMRYIGSGNTEDPLAGFNRFMGRPAEQAPEVKPFLEREGLLVN